jgi:hypothetical protein
MKTNQCHKPFPPPQKKNVKWGWCAAMTLRQYLVCRECIKVAQHWHTPSGLKGSLKIETKHSSIGNRRKTTWRHNP